MLAFSNFFIYEGSSITENGDLGISLFYYVENGVVYEAKSGAYSGCNTGFTAPFFPLVRMVVRPLSGLSL